MLHVALRMPREATPRRRRRRRRRRGPRGARPDGGVRGRVRSGEWTGHTGKPIRNVVNIGIGGSDLGPVMAYEALRHYSQRDLTFRFVSNVDSTDFVEATRDLDPDGDAVHRLLEDVHDARDDDQRAVGPRLGARRARRRAPRSRATSWRCRPTPTRSPRSASTPTTCSASGTGSAGRYSMDSAIGLSTMLAIGPERFREMLAGFHAMDEHFRTAPLAENLPVLMGLLGGLVPRLLRRPDGRRAALRAVPEALPRLPAAADDGVQRQARDARRASASTADTGAVYWGEPGTNGQHSFYQLLHQGTTLVPVDLIGFARTLNPLGDHHDLLSPTCSPRPRRWRSARPRRRCGPRARAADVVAAPGDGGQPALERDPRRRADARTARARSSRSTSTACSRRASIWGIDSFDQWGVELGKVLAKRIAPRARGRASEPALDHDSSTNALIRTYRQLKHD